MGESISAYPLQWPSGWERTSHFDRTYGRFNKRNQNNSWRQSLTIADGVNRVMESLGKMGVVYREDMIISTDLKLRLDGLPRSSQPQPEDPGACVYWTTASGDRRCMAIDRYTHIADNLAAISATLEAMRAIERHGGAEILNRAFTGFTALPSPDSEPWWSILGFYNEAEALFQGDYEIAAKKLLQRFHPDKEEADPWRFNQAIKAREQGREVRSQERQSA